MKFPSFILFVVFVNLWLVALVHASGSKGMFCKAVDDEADILGKGNCEQAKVNATVTEHVKSMESSIIAKMAEMEEKLLQRLSNLKVSLYQVKKEIQSEICGGFHYNGRCYWATVYAIQNTDYSEAVALCKDKAGEPADILDSKHYDLIMEYIRSIITSSNTYLWLGMTVTPHNGAVQLSNGVTAPYLNYEPNYPADTRFFTRMTIAVNKESSSEEQGMWNTRAFDDLHGVVCQK
uniref:uncharacterized protein LOC120346908 n=1 Tax=Styela clava TaxID=7725 RepID=UPI00193A0A2E|nr:uncharacterized protein LOC120346908 [Styela clava]